MECSVDLSEFAIFLFRWFAPPKRYGFGGPTTGKNMIMIHTIGKTGLMHVRRYTVQDFLFFLIQFKHTSRIHMKTRLYI